MEISFKASLLNKLKSSNSTTSKENLGQKQTPAKDEFLGSYKVSNKAKGNIILAGAGSLLLATAALFGKRLPKIAKAIMIPTGALASFGGIALTLKRDKDTNANILEETLPDGTKKTCNVTLNPDGSVIEKGRLIKPDGIIEEYTEHKNKDEVPLFVEKNIMHPDGKNYHLKIDVIPKGDKIHKTIKEITETDGTKITEEKEYISGSILAKDYDYILDSDSVSDAYACTRKEIKPNGEEIIVEKSTVRNENGKDEITYKKITKYPNGAQDVEQVSTIDGKDGESIEETAISYADGKKVKSKYTSAGWGANKQESEIIYPNGDIEKTLTEYEEATGKKETKETKYTDGKIRREVIETKHKPNHLEKQEIKIVYPDKKEETIIKESEYDENDNLIKVTSEKTLPDGTQTKEAIENKHEYDSEGNIIKTITTKTKPDGTKEIIETNSNYIYEKTNSGVKYPISKETRETRADGTVDTEKITYEYPQDVKEASFEYSRPKPIKATGEKYCADGKLHKFEESYLEQDGDYSWTPQVETGITTFADGGKNEYRVEFNKGNYDKIESGISHFANGDVKEYKEFYKQDNYYVDPEKVKEEYSITHADGTVESSKKELGADGVWIDVK